jgi:uncharacterized protein DUF993
VTEFLPHEHFNGAKRREGKHMNSSLLLPKEGGRIELYRLTSRLSPVANARFGSRIAYAAAHVVADPLAENRLGAPAIIDWQATEAFRHHLWSLGFGVAEAMDTAQRGMGLDWTSTKELIRRSCSGAATGNHRIVCGAGTDQLPPSNLVSLAEIEDAYLEQCEWIEKCGGRIVMMASRALASIATSDADYQSVYSRVLSQVSHPVILHWLGDMFDPALRGYWGSSYLDQAASACLRVIEENSSKIEGIKVSLLDKNREIELRRKLPPTVKMYTGDDFNYPELIRGDDQGHSDALLGIFDGIAQTASAAFRALDQNNPEQFEKILEPTLPLARHIFQAPTYYYKTGLVFLAFLNGHQEHFRMVGGFESARSVLHLAQLFVLADQAGALRDPEFALHRMRRFLAINGVE